MTEEVCARCNDLGDDRRTLWMSCLYDMDELGIVFEQIEVSIPNNYVPHFYTLRVCKSCRTDWLRAIKAWYDRPVKRKPIGTGVYVRDLGDTI